MSIKVYEGENLDELIERAKKELGDIEILYYEVEKKPSFIPFLRKKTYKLFVTKKEQKEKIEEDEIKKEIEELKNMLLSVSEEISKCSFQPVISYEELESRNVTQNLNEFTGDALELIDLLVKKGVDLEVAIELVKHSCGLDIETDKLDLSTATFREALIKGLEEILSFTGDLKISEGEKRVFAFLGPTGVGKTTNLFKLASKFVIEQQLKVGVISTDTFKVGAVQQARVYASILNVPFFVATDPKKLKEIVNNLENLDVILIDTVGRSHYDYFRLGEIKAILSGVGAPIENFLLISCNYDTREAMEVVNKYRSFFPIKYLFFTKIDETSQPGVLINVGYRSKLPVSYLSTGQRVPEDIRVLSPAIVADYLLGER
ncbi:flagellar biosynthesis protein FlhF [Balnearium lithotrophicum]|uniref:Flagellar biosynthesis protein FlhF n=1 Tax=Balnearium lithotrophicum TaxID=223788 RepID=A0A521CAV9_9BACT|nr:flagellar biosynthesis protein FlhF [Balnearium lithotrophicum]SMO56592.1 flagellar biosynthesis protein FlhF [Balnearium lithotrophicum]